MGDLYIQIGTRAQTTDAENLVVGYFIKHGTVRTPARSLSLENSQHPNAIGIHRFRRNYIKALMSSEFMCNRTPIISRINYFMS